MPQLRPGQPFPPSLPAQPLVLNVEVEYEGINGIWYRLAGAKVALYSQANPAGIPSRILKLGAFGSVTAQLSFYPVAAKVIFSDELFTLQQGPDRAHLSTWEFDLSIFRGMSIHSKPAEGSQRRSGLTSATSGASGTGSAGMGRPLLVSMVCLPLPSGFPPLAALHTTPTTSSLCSAPAAGCLRCPRTSTGTI